MTSGAKKQLNIPAFLSYEHRSKSGKLLGSGEMKKDKHGRIFIFQYDNKGKQISKSIFDKEGRELEEKNIMGIKIYTLKEDN